MPSRESMVKELTRLIDESTDPWRKAAFYEDPEVLGLLDELYDRWEQGGKVGIPLDYATDEEIQFLYGKAVNLRPEAEKGVLRKLAKRILPSGEEED